MKKSVTNTTCLPVITAPYLSRTLGLAQSGVYSFDDSIVTLFTIFGTGEVE